MEEKNVAIITGCSCGIKLETLKILPEMGFMRILQCLTLTIQETDKSIRENSGRD